MPKIRLAQLLCSIITLTLSASVLVSLSGCVASRGPGLDAKTQALLRDTENETVALTGNQEAWPTNVIKLAITSHLGDNQTYIEGDALYYLVSADRDCYLLFIYQDAEENLVQIIPNRYLENTHIQAGDFIRVPKIGVDFSFTIRAPFGEEHIYAFASSQPFPELGGEPLSNGFRLLETHSISKLRNELRGLSKSANALHTRPLRQFLEQKQCEPT